MDDDIPVLISVVPERQQIHEILLGKRRVGQVGQADSDFGGITVSLIISSINIDVSLTVAATGRTLAFGQDALHVTVQIGNGQRWRVDETVRCFNEGSLVTDCDGS